MAVTSRNYNSLFLICLIYVLTIQPEFSRAFAVPKPPVPPVCGAQVQDGVWPWIGLLGYDNKSSNVRLDCAATLLAPQTVITPAHCVYEEVELKYIRFRIGDARGPVDIPVQETIVHPQYEPISNINDVALVILSVCVRYTAAIRPICLPITNELRNNNFNNAVATVAGWEVTHSEGSPNPRLYQDQVPVVNTDTCKQLYGNLSNNFEIDEHVICARYPEAGRDACQGDSGGPLMLKEAESYYLIGIMSRGYQCAKPNVPGVFIRITYFLDFILSNLL